MENMTAIEERIFISMLKHDQHAYVTPNQQRLYVLVDGENLLRFDHNFSNMTDAQINQFIIDSLTPA